MLEEKGSDFKGGGIFFFFFPLSASQPHRSVQPFVRPSQPASFPFVNGRREGRGGGGRGREEAITHKIGANAEIKYLRKAMIACWERKEKKKSIKFFVRRGGEFPFFFFLKGIVKRSFRFLFRFLHI